jgi:hypothetical protein
MKFIDIKAGQYVYTSKGARVRAVLSNGGPLRNAEGAILFSEDYGRKTHWIPAEYDGFYKVNPLRGRQEWIGWARKNPDAIQAIRDAFTSMGLVERQTSWQISFRSAELPEVKYTRLYDAILHRYGGLQFHGRLAPMEGRMIAEGWRPASFKRTENYVPRHRFALAQMPFKIEKLLTLLAECQPFLAERP